MKWKSRFTIISSVAFCAAILMLISPRPTQVSALQPQDEGAQAAPVKTARVSSRRGPRMAGSSNSSAANSAQTVEQQSSSTPTPEVIPMIGPVSQDQDLRNLPYIPPKAEDEDHRLSRHPPSQNQAGGVDDPTMPVTNVPALAMPTPIQTFPGMSAACGGCLPPDTDGDIGQSHYIQSVNSSIRIFNKAGTSLSGPTTYNSFFSALGASTPCGNNQNDGDGVVFYDHIANRWVVSDFAFPAFPGTSFYQCIGVSKTGDPVAGGWWLYAMQVDPANPTFLGDYPKFGMWPDAYYMSVNLFSNNTTFNGVRVYALPRSAMVNGTGAPNPGAIAFTLTPATLGDAYSLVPASYRTGLIPPAGRPDYFMAINSSAVAGTVETQVFTWKFHADFAVPANSTFGLGATHTPDGTTTVNGFVDAFTSTNSTNIVPQTGTARLLDTLGDKLMYPLVYQNLAGVESIYAAHTINNNQGGTGPTAIRWYQFNVTGNTIPATPLQQQTFNNSADGLWRFMPSLNVDGLGNLAIGYSESSSTTNPAIAYAGRLITDAPNTLAQGEAILQAGIGHQTSASGRWGDYSATFVDPGDNCTFWHTNEYYTATSGANWATRIGTFKFPTCVLVPTAAESVISGQVTTSDGTALAGVTLVMSGAQQGRAVTDSNGFYRFDNMQAGGFYTISPMLTNYSFSPSNHSFSLLGNKTDATFTATPDTITTGNAIDSAEYFVRQQYMDFLGREPDSGGFNYWSNRIQECGSDAACIRERRIDVSAAYFMSDEFQQTGSFVYRLYKASYGVMPTYSQFIGDRGRVVAGGNLDASRNALTDQFVSRSEFRAAYPEALSSVEFVNRLCDSAGVSVDRQGYVNLMNGGATRAEVLRQVIEDEGFKTAEFNRSFVLMQYFGYLRRDADDGGMSFWMDVLNNRVPGNYRSMVCAFLTSSEYQRRFGSVVTRSNSECGQ
ncbi:MAG TPA: DUF4214 domain-containing protein [Pyrinomonadaceae bacterium]|nr:DUF4214 domain-containing protein [Pyrinomonadaceae bacterium]